MGTMKKTVWLVLLAWLAFACVADRRADRGDQEHHGPTERTSAPLNPIPGENALPGTNPFDLAGPPAVPGWDLLASEEEPAQVAGYTGQFSYGLSEPVDFHVSSTSAYEVRIYRIGYYAGKGARLVKTLAHGAAANQTPCGGAEPYSCNWSQTDLWADGGAISGVYIARLVRSAAPTKGSHVMFVVRDDQRQAEILLQTSDATWQAYNAVGPNFYSSPSAKRITYRRPMNTRSAAGTVESFFGGEYQMIRFLEKNGYDVSYTTNIDTATRGTEILAHKVFLSVGHDEYWSKEMRDNVEAARDAGVHLAFFSGNEVYWKTRNEEESPGTGFTTLTCYKSSAHGNPQDPVAFTGTWRDPRFRTSTDPLKPENALTGTLFMVNGTMLRPLRVDYEESRLRQWRNVPMLANLSPCQSVEVADKAVGAEWDEDADNGFRPPGLFRLSTTALHRAPVAMGHSSNSAGYVENATSGQSTHHMTLYRHASGALVFGAGTEQIAWALDNHQGKRASVGTPSLAVKQFVVNLLADMTAQPASLDQALQAASASTDTTPPVVTISTPAPSSTLTFASAVTVSGTAADVDGVVAGVEVSTDDGATWHPAEGRGTWRYTWMTTLVGAKTISVRAVDDSGNLSPASSIDVTVGCDGACTIWGSSAPSSSYSADPSPVNIGVKFRSDADGTISGIRFYRDALDTGPHTAYLWGPNGAADLLASATFTGGGSGWVTATFAAPVPIDLDKNYYAAIHTQTGFRYLSSAFASGGVYSPPLRALVGRYTYGAAGVFPATNSNNNYFIDVNFTPTTQPGLERNLFLRDFAPPASYSSTPNNELGLRFKSDRDGYVTGIRFWRAAANTANQVVNLWGPAPAGAIPNPAASNEAGKGLLLASATYLDGGFGWVDVRFAAPVKIWAGREYVASYFSSTGYSYSQYYFDTPSTIEYYASGPPLRALAGVYDASGKTHYPRQTYRSSNYWVDVDFVPTGPHDAMFWPDGLAPDAQFLSSSPVTLGMRFQPETDGYVAGVRFFKNPANTGTHSGGIWPALGGGYPLASGTFANETECGWQTLYFAQPVAVLKDQLYTAAYHTTTGYSYTYDFFAGKDVTPPAPDVLLRGGQRGIWAGSMRSIADLELFYPYTVRNGSYAYGGFGHPQDGYFASNYWVDVVVRTTK